jgi:signal transduction histidine kinase
MSSAMSSGAGSEGVSNPGVLLVDDRPENLVAMEAALAPLGYDIVTAGSGEDALRHLLLREFSLVILDVQMPGIDGFETAQAIKARERTSDIPILFLTAISREEQHRLHGYETGGVDYLFKPISSELLRAKASVFVQLHEQRRQLLAQRAELERLNRDLEQFTYVASHDLQEPLRVVAGYLELLESHLPADDERGRMFVDRAATTALRMGALLRDLLVVARAGGGQGEPASVDLAGAVAAALGNLDAAVAESGAKVEVDDGLPPVMGVEVEVVQLLQNVIGNSVRHRGQAAPLVRVGARHVGGNVEIEVADNGPGVPEADVERVFGLFERVEGSPYPGTGLGLPICRRIVEHRGGRIWMTSAPGSGATVHITLPAAT